MIDPQKHDISYIEKALETLFHMKECCYDPVKWLNEQYSKYKKLRRPLKTVAISLNAGLVYVRRVQITPTKVYFCGPDPIVSNRVLRHYQNAIDNFLRVSFVDEDLDKLYSTALTGRTTKGTKGSFNRIYERLICVLKNGLHIGGRKFEFLAFSSSQLRENSCWMFASTPGLTARDIRNWMGDFSTIRNVAKYAARLGQSFGSSMETLSVPQNEVAHIPDVKLSANGMEYNFSDGIGKILSGFANKVSKKCHIKGRTPSAFQIRYGGYKGVVAVDPLMKGSAKLALRPSMCKYESTNIKLDVLSWSKSQHCFLNRQLITLLSTLGIQDFVFERKQKEIINQLDTVMTDRLRACDILDTLSSGEITRVLKEMLLVGYKPDSEPFLSRMLKTFHDYKLLELQYKSRIYIENGRALMGCLDETRTLKYGQVFVQYSHSNSKRGKSIAKGKLIVAKNPCLHPGDIRVLEAIDVPSLRHMVDCVVFPQKGMRPHPNECSGSDLDGDIYFVSWDPDLIPSLPFSPMDYTAAPNVLLDHDVTIEEVEEYFVNYMVNDSLGMIANTHTAFADQSENKAMSNECVELAKLFSIAVDFPKTGVPAVIPTNLHAEKYPDFMEKPEDVSYESKNVIGKLYREVKSITEKPQSRKYFSLADALESYDRDMEVNGFENYIDDAFYFKDCYDRKLRDLMAYYKIKREAEIISGNIMSFVKSFKKKRDAEAISEAVKSLKKEARGWFNEKSISNHGPDDPCAKASAWYYVTYHPDCWEHYDEVLDKREHHISFPWCVYDKLIHIKKDKMRRGQSSHMSILEQHFAIGLRLL
uniref:RNA-dependent RNA polymerase n=1 Tax=Kalanchoe fedtschenkoi TaxID=63787 RepID=A0A7N0V1N8_KALFE